MAVSFARVVSTKRNTLAACLLAALAAGAGASQMADAVSRGPQGSRDMPAHRTHVDSEAGVIQVTSCADDGSDGTLRKAIENASDGDTIDLTALQCSLITLQAGALVVQAADLALLGPGIDALTIDGGNVDRVLTAQSLEISDLAITHGAVVSDTGGGCILAQGNVSLTRVRVADCMGSSASASFAGGGAAIAGYLVMRESHIEGNNVAAANLAVGGGLVVGGAATVYDSTVSGNVAHAIQGPVLGGAIAASGGVTLYRTSITGNSARSDAGIAYGGGIHAKGAFAVSILDGSTISGNLAHSDTTWSYGGGISSGTPTNPETATVAVDHSTISGNTAESGCAACSVVGGGVRAVDSIVAKYSTINDNHAICTDVASTCNADGGGVAIYGALQASSTTLLNVTISANNADGATLGEGSGGGIVSGNGKPIIAANTTIAFNRASTSGGGVAGLSPPASPSLFTSTLVSNNDSAGSPGDVAPGPFGMGQTMTIDGSNNLVVSFPMSVLLPGDTLSDDPHLLALTTDDGGSTAVHPLDVNSPAIDAGNNPNLLGCDQRGYPYHRVTGAAPDIGAYEEQGERHLFTDGFDPLAVCPPAGP